ncbi:MAG: hypothetical protein CMK23_01005 [Porticoccaceae bacterium]|nr:hypothetical protein [Porticoccaceae bacterium]
MYEWQEQWEHAKPFIEKAVAVQDLYTIDDVADKIGDGSFLLWPGTRSAMITEFVDFPQKKICNLLFCGGDYEELEAITNHVEIFAKRMGCSALYGGGRPGWARKIKHLGWKPEYVIRKDIK